MVKGVIKILIQVMRFHCVTESWRLACIEHTQIDAAHVFQRNNKQPKGCSTGCPTTYQTRQFFNNFTTNEDIATKFEADLPHCVRNVTAS